MKKGFTLIETLVGISIITGLLMAISLSLSKLVATTRTSDIEKAVLEDIRVLEKKLVTEIQNGAVDYEEYFSINVIQSKDGGKIPEGGPYYGINYGVYGSRFFNPGKRLDGKLAKNPDDLGIECSYPKDPKLPCEIFYTHSEDLSTGQNPYKAGTNEPDDADAFCDNIVGKCDEATKIIADELYLIDRSGTQKTIIGRRKINTYDSAIAWIKMYGKDLDQNGMIDVFGCMKEFNCEKDPYLLAQAIKYPFIKKLAANSNSKEWADYLKANNVRLPKKTDLNELYSSNTSHFFPILSEWSTVKDLKFTITPVEDPYKAYAETGNGPGEILKNNPTVTIIFTIGLSEGAKKKYPGEFEDITVKTTVRAGVRSRIDSYPPVNDIFRTATDKSWISEVLPFGVKH